MLRPNGVDGEDAEVLVQLADLHAHVGGHGGAVLEPGEPDGRVAPHDGALYVYPLSDADVLAEREDAQLGRDYPRADGQGIIVRGKDK